VIWFTDQSVKRSQTTYAWSLPEPAAAAIRPITGIAGCCARHERPRRRRAAEQRDELASFQLIEFHSIPAAKAGLQDIELARISQEVTGRFCNLLAGGMGGRCLKWVNRDFPRSSWTLPVNPNDRTLPPLIGSLAYERPAALHYTTTHATRVPQRSKRSSDRFQRSAAHEVIIFHVPCPPSRQHSQWSGERHVHSHRIFAADAGAHHGRTTTGGAAAGIG
jgi:hypothetical protein